MKGKKPTYIVRNKKTLSSRWMVFYTRARNEKKCERKLQERDIEVFLPKCRVKRQWSDRIKKVTLPLFPNYIFANINERERLQVLKTSGIAYLVTFRGKPAVLDDEQIRRLQITQEDPERLETLSHQLPELGSLVKVKEGPFEGLTGRVLEHRNEMSLVVQLDVIQQSVRVKLDGAHVEEIEPASSGEKAKKVL